MRRALGKSGRQACEELMLQKLLQQILPSAEHYATFVFFSHL